MRARTERRIRKQLRIFRGKGAPQIGDREPLGPALQRVMLDTKAGWYTRGIAARLVAISDPQGTLEDLLHQFFSQKEKIELWETALTIEWFGDRAAVRPLISALDDENFDRRHAAARTLGVFPTWMLHRRG